jgi:hypothetical protein
MTNPLEDEVKTISGKELADFLNVIPSDYKVLYPNMNREYKEKVKKVERIRRGTHYCACYDLGIDWVNCQGMLTVMDAFKIPEIKDFPARIIPITWGKYKSGDVLIDDRFEIGYLYIGKSSEDEDVVLNLGGDTDKKGEIQRGSVNRRENNMLFSTRKVFPKNTDYETISRLYLM